MPIPSPSLTGSLFPFSRAAGATNTLPSGPNINQTVFGPQSPAPKSFLPASPAPQTYFTFDRTVPPEIQRTLQRQLAKLPTVPGLQNSGPVIKLFDDGWRSDEPPRERIIPAVYTYTRAGDNPALSEDTGTLLIHKGYAELITAGNGSQNVYGIFDQTGKWRPLSPERILLNASSQSMRAELGFLLGNEPDLFAMAYTNKYASDPYSFESQFEAIRNPELDPGFVGPPQQHVVPEMETLFAPVPATPIDEIFDFLSF